MTGYIRKDTTNNIADGNVINATDLDNEFDGVQAAFVVATGHTHDGTASEGAAITKIGPVQDVVVSISSMSPKTTNTIDLGTSSLKYKDAFFAGNETVGGTLAVTGVATLTAQPVLSSLTASSAVATDASKGLVSVTNTGTGNNVLATSPTLVTPILGTPQSVTLTNATGLPISTGVSGLGTGVATALAVNVGTAGAPVVNGGVLGTPSSGTVTNLTGTASININGTVGATTANTGAFTTLTTSSTMTLNGGTANGVAYLNGSKQVTTGSALTFDGTTLGVTNASASVALNVTKSADGNTAFFRRVGGTYNPGMYISLSDTVNNEIIFNTTYSSGNAPAYVWQNAGSEAMRLTSTGLGIGTSSPGVKLDVVGAIRATGQITTNTGIAGFLTQPTTSTDPAYASFINGGGTTRFGSNNVTGAYTNTGTGGAYGVFIDRPTATTFEIGSNTRLDMHISASGSLGLGVVPSAWGDNRTGFQVGKAALWNVSTINSWAGLSANMYHNAGGQDTYIGTGESSQYLQVGGAHAWYTAPGGTAGAAISFTQAMTLDASGNWMLGATAFSGTPTQGVHITPSYSSLNAAGISIGHVTGTATGAIYETFAYNGGTIGSITQTGTTGVLYNVTSDQRLKENIQDAAPASALIDAIQVRQYNWKSDGSHQRYGFVAQELVAVAPEAVHQPENPEEMMAVDYSKLVPMLVKEIQDLRKRVSALEPTGFVQSFLP